MEIRLNMDVEVQIILQEGALKARLMSVVVNKEVLSLSPDLGRSSPSILKNLYITGFPNCPESAGT